MSYKESGPSLKGDRPLDQSIAECEVVLIALASGLSRGPIILIIAGLFYVMAVGISRCLSFDLVYEYWLRSLLKPYFGVGVGKGGELGPDIKVGGPP